MKTMFLKRGSSSFSGEPELTLAAFGKHPGWDDHIPGLGLETEALASCEKSLYDTGIRGQIDSGAWSAGKLDPAQRLEGYDHLFLWSQPGHLLLGQFWSSMDGKGRPNYPMVLCIDGEAVGAGLMVGALRLGLDKLRDSCKAATTADKVMQDCKVAQGQLRALLNDPAAKSSDSPPPAEVKRKFLEHPELGPNRLGLLRVLHELSSVPGLALRGKAAFTSASAAASVGSRHLRLPLAANSRSQALLLWMAFLKSGLSDSTSTLLLARRGVPWIDLIVGQPVSEDFFCLQASEKALPLTTEIPYEVSTELTGVLAAIELEFLQSPPAIAAEAPATSKPRPAPAGTPVPAPTPIPAEAAQAAPTGKKKPWFLFGGAGLLLMVGAIALVVLRGSNKSAKEVASSALAAVPESKPPAVDVDFQQAIGTAQTAAINGDYSNAVAEANKALHL
ncbi:MAG TPA: hypothetical protein VLT36_14585, partial [Candidatus Dormibacteraeota bacterium]|nr:hypothetical protein [Candidatus Dormibacteraeota bacterium]